MNRDSAIAKLPMGYVGEPEFAVQPPAVRARVQQVITTLESALLECGTVGEAQVLFAERMGWPKKTAHRWWLRVMRHGWRGAIDSRRTVREVVEVEGRLAFIAFFRALCEKHNRSCRAAWEDACMLWRTGHEIPGYEDLHGHPPAHGRTGLPKGWSYNNLIKFAPEDKELLLSRMGRKAFLAATTSLHTTRVGLRCGQVYQFDDVWHDHKVFLGSKLVRPIELGCIDLFSTRRVLFGLAPRVRDDRGAAENIKERYMLWLTLAVLTETGYNPEACSLIVEHRTAAIPEWFERRLADQTQGVIRVERSGIQDKAALLGWWAGEGGGNPRMKAALESLQGYYHNRFGALPAQTGSNSRLNEPEDSVALGKYSEELHRALQKLSPERCEALLAQLKLPALTFHQFHRLLLDYYTVIDSRTAHRLEGWERAGLVRAQFRLGETSQDWLDAEALVRMPEAQQQAVRSWVESNPALMRQARLSPLEVWTAGRKNLRKLPRWTIHQLLGDEFAREIKVRNHRIEFQDAEIDPEPLRYEAAVSDVNGHKVLLNEGDSYKVFVNPLAPDTLYVTDARSRYVGTALRILRAPRVDREALLQAVGKEAARQMQRMDGWRARHEGEAVAHAEMLEHNRRVLAGEPVTADEKAAERVRRSAIASLDPTVLLDDEERTPVTESAPVGVGDDDEPDISKLL